MEASLAPQGDYLKRRLRELEAAQGVGAQMPENPAISAGEIFGQPQIQGLTGAQPVAPNCRPIELIQLHLEVAPGPPPTEPPVFLDVDPRTLLVEPAYQRDLTPKSLEMIRKIAAGWDWRKYHPPVVVMTDDGGLILDGQHTAIAAASWTDLATIPVQLVDAPEVTDRAQAFLGLNTGHLAHSAVGLHRAAVAAGDVTALAVQRICQTAGVAVRTAYGGAKWNPGDTAAVAAIRGLLANVGERRATQIMNVLATAQLAPIGATHIKAAELLFTDPDFAGRLDALDDQGGADLAAAISELGDTAGREASVFAKAQCIPLWRALGIIWFRKAKKRRKVL